MHIVIGLFAAAAVFYLPIAFINFMQAVLNAFLWVFLGKAFLYFLGFMFTVTTLYMFFGGALVNEDELKKLVFGNFQQDRVHDYGLQDDIPWVTQYAPIYGAVNGYAYIPEGHVMRQELDLNGVLHYSMLEDVSVHGGLTYANEGWVGFDTLHAGDVWPQMPQEWRGLPWVGEIHWTPEMVVEEAKTLASFIASLNITLDKEKASGKDHREGPAEGSQDS